MRACVRAPRQRVGYNRLTLRIHLAAGVSVDTSDDKPVTTDYCNSLLVDVDPDTKKARQVSDATVRSGTVAIASARSLLRDTVDE